MYKSWITVYNKYINYRGVDIMFSKLLTLVFDENGDLKFGLGIGLIAACIVLMSIVEGM